MGGAENRLKVDLYTKLSTLSTKRGWKSLIYIRIQWNERFVTSHESHLFEKKRVKNLDKQEVELLTGRVDKGRKL